MAKVVNDVFASGDVLEAGCNVHGRRKFRDAEAAQPVLAVEGGAFLGAIYDKEEKAQKLRREGAALREHRQRFIRPIAQEFALARRRRAHAPAVRAAGGGSRLLPETSRPLFRFINDPRIPMNNSPTERVFQNVAKLRLNMFFAGSSEGAHRACVLLGMLSRTRHSRTGLSRLGFRTPRYPSRRLRTAARTDDPGGLQEEPRLSTSATRTMSIGSTIGGCSARSVTSRRLSSKPTHYAKQENPAMVVGLN